MSEFKQIYSALAKAQIGIQLAQKNGYNPQTNSTYADLGSVIEAVRPSLGTNGLIILQDIREGSVWTIIAHESGEFLELAPIPLAVGPGNKATNANQAFGSALSYARRQSLQCALGIGSVEADGRKDDDDGNRSSNAEDPTYNIAEMLAGVAKATTVEAVAELWAVGIKHFTQPNEPDYIAFKKAVVARKAELSPAIDAPAAPVAQEPAQEAA